MEMRVSPVKQAALSLELPVAQPDTIRTTAISGLNCKRLKPEAIVCVATADYSHG